MAKITIKLSSKVRTDGKCQVVAFVSVTRTNRFHVKTPVFISRELFNEETSKVIIPRKGKAGNDAVREAMIQSSELDSFMGRLTSILSAGNPSGEISKEWFEHVLSLQDNDDISLKTNNINRFDIERALNEESRINEEARKKEQEELIEKERMTVADAVAAYRDNNNFSNGRNKMFSGLISLIKRFEMFKALTDKPGFVLYIDTMTTDDASDLRYFLANEYQLATEYPKLFAKILKAHPLASNPKKPRTLHERGNNYVIQKMKAMKATFNWLYKTEQTNNQPFKKMVIGCGVYGSPIYITTEERNTIADFDLSNESATIQAQRDIFVFQCLVGCRVGDMTRLTIDNISNGVLEYIPSKTEDNNNQVKPRVPLSPRALDLVEKYKGIDKKGRLFPFISDQQYNDAIKEIFTLCGITRTVIVRNSISGKSEAKPINEIASSHMARRTFVGAAYKVVKDPNLIGSMSGHVPGSAAFNRYRAIDDDDLRGVINMIG